MANCYVCGRILDENNRTEEHILLNAIGGHLSSDKIICRNCNSILGDDMDSELANQLNFVANMFNIRRDRGKPQPFDAVDKKNNKTYSILPGGKPNLKIPCIERNNNHYTIEVRDKKQLARVLRELKRKHAEIDDETLIKECTIDKKYLDDGLSFDIKFGGPLAFRSLCKTAVNFYIHKGGSPKNIRHLIPYIKGDTDYNVVSFMYLNEPPILTNSSELLHSIILRGDEKEKILFAYIELFDFYKAIALLNDNYEDKNVEYRYFFDVLSRKEIIRDYKLPLTRKMLESYQKLPFEYSIKKLISQLKVVIEKSLKKQDREHLNELLKEAVENAQRKIAGRNMTNDEMADIFVQETMENLMPWVLHNFS